MTQTHQNALRDPQIAQDVVVDLRLDSIEGVLTEAMNNGTRERRGFRQVWASMQIITLRPVCVVVC
jgi:hypothetical protein